MTDRDKLIRACESVFGETRFKVDDGLEYVPPVDCVLVRVYATNSPHAYDLQLDPRWVIDSDEQTIALLLREKSMLFLRNHDNPAPFTITASGTGG